MSIVSYTDDQLDAGANALRFAELGTYILLPWEQLPNSTKIKWRNKARAVLDAALKIDTGND